VHSRPLSPPLSIQIVPAEQLAELRRAAADYVARATGCALDGSEESLAYVDHYLDRLRADPPRRAEALRLVAFALGTYLGDLAIARFGGRWLALPAAASAGDAAEATSDPSLAPLAWRVDLDAAPLRFDPIGMAVSAFSDLVATDDAELVGLEADDGISLRPGARSLQAALHGALARLAPVSADYYYSFTGRFETLAHIVELTVELQGQAAARSADTDAEADASADRPLVH
jgi:hypothetical protein